MGWDGGNTGTSWNAAGSSYNPLSPENYMPGFRWGNGSNPASPFIGAGFSINRYVTMADYSTGGDLASGRYHGAPNAVNATTDFNYRYSMSGETGWHYGRET